MTREEIVNGIQEGLAFISTDDFIAAANESMELTIHKKGDYWTLDGIPHDPNAAYIIKDDFDIWEEETLSPLIPDLAEILTDMVYDNSHRIRSLPESVRAIVNRYSRVRVDAILLEIEKLEKELALATRDLKEALKHGMD